MAENEPKYRAWLIRHSGRMTVITGVFLWFLIPIGVTIAGLSVVIGMHSRGTSTEKTAEFYLASWGLIFAIMAPLFFSTLAINILAGFGAREQVIKNTGMIVYFVIMGFGVFAAWNIMAIIGERGLVELCQHPYAMGNFGPMIENVCRTGGYNPS